MSDLFGDSKVDSNNSTNTPLGISGVYTGTATDIVDCGIVFVSVYSDVASATDGCSLQQSTDGTNWDFSDDFTISAGSGKNFSLNPHAKYYRVVYTNGAIAQTEFRLQSICKSINAKPSSHRIKDDIVGDDDGTLVVASLQGENGDGKWHRVKTTADGYLAVSDNSSGLAISEGNVTGKTFEHKFGEAPDFDTADGSVTVWDGAEDGEDWELMNYVYSTTDDIDRVSSSSAADTYDLAVVGLDVNYDIVEQVVTLTGQTPVVLATPLIRVFRMYNDNSTDFVGHIFCFVNGTTTGGVPDTVADIRAVIQPGNNQTLMSIFTVPAGKIGYLRDLFAAVAGASKNSNYVIRLLTRDEGKVFRLKYKSALNETGTSYFQHKYEEPERYSEKTDIEVQVEATGTGVTGANITGGFDLVLEDV